MKIASFICYSVEISTRKIIQKEKESHYVKRSKIRDIKYRSHYYNRKLYGVFPKYNYCYCKISLTSKAKCWKHVSKNQHPYISFYSFLSCWFTHQILQLNISNIHRSTVISICYYIRCVEGAFVEWTSERFRQGGKQRKKKMKDDSANTFR